MNDKRSLLLVLFLATIMAAMAQTYDANRGFRHPGGLHTQADFDRVKAQLADGNERVTAAYNVLKTAAYAQPGVQTYPVETIVRGGTGENYINAARGATMAYQNALRWKIEGNEACARGAVRILMAWANTTKEISGSSDQCLAVGLYGYEFAQAAELMRDYDGWSRDDFETFQQWMLKLWYPKAIHFLRSRNGTWENSGKWWKAPGHYWSNWGLCNALCVVSIGVLCDDVFIYNQGMSFFKYDQVGTYRNPRTEVPIKNDGLTEFLGNLVGTTVDTDLETGAYGQMGQMNESGRDTGHSAMALGLAVDLAKMGWNQGDDLFSYMDYRLAAGIEYVAAQTQSVPNLPWTNYHYGSSGYYYSDSRAWLMTEPALGAQMRPYWGTVIGLYEGVKGVRMPFAEASYQDMGIDAGGMGSTSGGYDHLGYSVLMNTFTPQLRPADEVPTELSPLMEYDATLTNLLVPSLAQERQQGNIDGSTLRHSELGGLVNTYESSNRTCLPKGHTVKLRPQLPDGETDTGLWRWNTGEQTRDITVTTDRSQAYRVTYTNARGIDSELLFTLAVEGDNRAAAVEGSITYQGQAVNDTILTLFYGETVTLKISGGDGYGTYRWQNGTTAASLTTGRITSDTIITATYMNQSYTPTEVRFHLNVRLTRPDIVVNGVQLTDTLMAIVQKGDNVVLSPYVPASLSGMTYEWTATDTDADMASFDLNTRTLTFAECTQSGLFTLTCRRNGNVVATYPYRLYVVVEADTVATGYYLIRHVASNTYLTSNGKGKRLFLDDQQDDSSAQVWLLERSADNGRYNLRLAADTTLYATLSFSLLETQQSQPFILTPAAGSNYVAISLRSGYYLQVADDLSLDFRTEKSLRDFPFELQKVDYDPTGIESIDADAAPESRTSAVYDLSGRRLNNGILSQKGRPLQRGIYIVGGQKRVIR